MRRSILAAIAGSAAVIVTACALCRRREASVRHVSSTIEEYENAHTRILILGGGFGGVKTALELDRRLRDVHDAAVLLVNRDTTMLFVPLLWTLADGRSAPNHITVPLRALQKGRSFHFLKAEVRGIDIERRIVETTAGERPFDFLVIALGSVTAVPDVPGLRQHAHVFRSIADALQLRNRIVDAVERAHQCEDAAQRDALLTFTVIGGGDTGTELAATINDFIKNALVNEYPWLFDTPARVVIIERMERILPLATAEVAQRVQAVLETAGVQIHTGAAVQEITEDAVRADGIFIQTRTVFWAAGITATDVVRALPVERERNGSVVVDDHLRIPGHEEIYVVGDAAWANDGITGRPVPALAQSAEHEARYVAREIAQKLVGRPVDPFHFTKLGEMMLLGSCTGVAEIGPVTINGFLAWLLWHLYYLSHIGLWRNRVLLATDWLLAALLGPETGQLRFTGETA
ncbi:MAG: NAD(P)/FAD-dependent oxidoreductase [Vulcanimicrobiaceae bacterium]